MLEAITPCYKSELSEERLLLFPRSSEFTLLQGWKTLSLLAQFTH